VTGYKVFRATGSAAPAQLGTTLPATASSFNDTTASAGVIYNYTVKAVTAPGDSAPSAAESGYRALSAPTTIAATDGLSTMSVTLTWSVSTGAVRYKVFRTAAGSTSEITPTTPITGTSFTDSGAVPGTIYTYAVRAVGGTGVNDSQTSAADAGHRALSAPANLAATDGLSTTSITLTWTASTGATRYKIFRGIGSASSDITPASPAITGTSFTDTTATPGTVYTYAVKAVGPTGVADSAASVSNTGYRGLSAPTTLAAGQGTSASGVNLTWTGSTGATGYRVYRAIGTGVPGLIGSPTSNAFTDTGASTCTVYTYTVRATGPTGVSESQPSNAATGWRGLPAPTGLTATTNLSTMVKCTWSPVPGAVSYTLRRVAPGGITLIVPGITSTSYNDTNAGPNITYTYLVKAVCAAGAGAESAGVSGKRTSALVASDDSKPADGGEGGYAPNDGSADDVPQQDAPAAMGVQRYLQVVAITPDAVQNCDGAAHEQAPVDLGSQSGADAGESEAPSTFIDLDGNGLPDLCQLRRGDLDLNGRMDEADLALLLTMLGEEPVLGFGDLNGDGVIDGSDVQSLSQRMDALVNTT
jgi:hypothetical protein